MQESSSWTQNSRAHSQHSVYSYMDGNIRLDVYVSYNMVTCQINPYDLIYYEISLFCTPNQTKLSTQSTQRSHRRLLCICMVIIIIIVIFYRRVGSPAMLVRFCMPFFGEGRGVVQCTTAMHMATALGNIDTTLQCKTANLKATLLPKCSVCDWPAAAVTAVASTFWLWCGSTHMFSTQYLYLLNYLLHVYRWDRFIANTLSHNSTPEVKCILVG